MHQQELMKDDDICIFLLVHIYYLLMYQYRSRDLLLEVANITGKNLQYSTQDPLGPSESQETNTAPLEMFWRISLFVTDDAIGKLYVT